MAMQWQPVPYPIVGGLDEKTQKWVLGPPKLEQAVNVYIDKSASVTRRYGFSELTGALISKDGVDEATLATAESVLSYRGAPIVITSPLAELPRVGAAWNGVTEHWGKLGQLPCYDVRTEGITADANLNALCGDHASNEGLTVYAWLQVESSLPALYVSVVDTATGNQTLAPRRVSTNAQMVRCVASSTVVHVFFVDVAALTIRDLIVRVGDTATNLIASFNATPVTTASDTNSGSVFDAVDDTQFGGGAFLAYITSAGALKYGFVDEFGALQDSNSSAVTGPPVRIACCAVSGVGRYGVAYVRGTAVADVYAKILEFDGAAWTVVATSTVIDAPEGLSGAIQVACEFDPYAPTILRIWWSDTFSNGGVAYSTQRVVQCSFDTSGTETGAIQSTRHSTQIISRPFLAPSGLLACWVIGSGVSNGATGIQDTAYLIDSDGNTIAQALIAQANGATILLFGLPANVDVNNDNHMVLTYERRVEDSWNGFDNGSIAVRGLKLRHVPADLYKTAETGDTLYIAGSILMALDGLSFTEAGFLRPSELNEGTVTSGIVGGGLTPGAIYSYRVIPEVTNSRGERFLGTDAGPSLVTIGVGDDGATLVWPSIAHTWWRGDRPNFVFGVYRSGPNPSIDAPLYRIGQVENDPTANAVTFVDNVTTAIGELEQLYLVSEQDNVPVVPGHIMTSGANRLFIAGLDDGNEIRASKIKFPSLGVGFGDASIQIPDDGGRITALAFMNESLVVFKDSRIYRVRGAGPDNSALPQGGFLDPELVSSDTGAIHQGSVVLTPMGLMFASRYGIQLLDQGYQLTYVGAPVEETYRELIADTESVDVPGPTRTTLVPFDQHVHFAFGPTELVFDYLHRQWFVWTYPEGNSKGPAIVYGDDYCFAHSGAVARCDRTIGIDADQEYAAFVRTGWFKAPPTLQGRMRIRRVGIVGEALDAHTLTLTLSKDYEESPYQTIAQVIDTSGLIDYEWRSDKQPMESIQVTFTDGVTGVRTWRIAALNFEVGFKKGLRNKGLGDGG